MLNFESSRAAGEDVLTQCMPRHEDGTAILEADVDHVDLVVMTSAQVDGLGEADPYWSKSGLNPATLFVSPPVAWDLDSVGYNFEHRLAWEDDDDTGQMFAPSAGSTVHLYFFLWRINGLGPAVVHHAASFVYAPRWAVSP